jgi:hypothetical protein
MKDGSDETGLNEASTSSLGEFYTHIFDANKDFITYIDCNLHLHDKEKGGSDESGPNEASCFVWAPGEFFLKIFVFFNTS